MKYRDIIGFSTKKQKFVKKTEKKVAPKPTTPLVTELLKEEFGLLNEGPAGDYAKAYTDVKKTYGAFWDSVHEFESLLKSKGLGRHAKEVNKQYKNTVEKFFKFFHKMMDKLQ